MLIGVLSDTHIPKRARELPKKIYDAFKEVDLILHAGDITEPELLDKITQMTKKEVKAVQGNMDSARVKAILPHKEEIEIGKFRIGLTHGTGSADYLIEFVKKQFKKVDVIVFGHSHLATNKKENGILLFNPGSPSDNLFSPYLSYGILHIGNQIRGEIVKI